MLEHHKKRLDPTYRLSRKIVFLILILFCCFDAYSEECVEFLSSGVSGERPYSIYFRDGVEANILCPELVLMTVGEFSKYKTLEDEYSSVNTIEPTDIAASFSWGFGTYLSFWWLAYVIRTAKKTIKIL